MKAGLSKSHGFSLVELVVVIAIIGMLTTLAIPNMGRIMDKARNTTCMNNMRQIGVAVGLYTADNSGAYPFINNPNAPVYNGGNLPEGVQAQTMVEAFGPYGITKEFLKCPADIKGPNNYAKNDTSYEWKPTLDGESVINPKIYGRRGVISLQDMIAANPGKKPRRLSLVMDTDSVHAGRKNYLFSDGSVSVRTLR
jgi:prepilin-type N-terminal cleavage/methylation domain-containing protein/prepilin-type processing-associated H-X9-DG protein